MCTLIIVFKRVMKINKLNILKSIDNVLIEDAINEVIIGEKVMYEGDAINEDNGQKKTRVHFLQFLEK